VGGEKRGSNRGGRERRAGMQGARRAGAAGVAGHTPNGEQHEAVIVVGQQRLAGLCGGGRRWAGVRLRMGGGSNQNSCWQGGAPAGRVPGAPWGSPGCPGACDRGIVWLRGAITHQSHSGLHGHHPY
jgi:hypothetical protein